MPPHLFGQHAPSSHIQPRPQQPLRNAEALGLWHEPPRIRRRRAHLPDFLALAVIVGALALFAWTLPASHTPADATIIAGRAGQ